MTKAMKNKFWKNVAIIPFHDCWEWIGAKTGSGYGSMIDGYKNISAHKFSFQLHKGKIKKGYFICHSCDNPGCVRPEHLFLGSQSDNIKDMYKKGRGKILQRSGSNHYLSKFSENKIKQIRCLHSRGNNIRYLVRIFKSNYSTIYDIVARKTWKHI